jgi:uncharacterized protein (DUF2147 family)
MKRQTGNLVPRLSPVRLATALAGFIAAATVSGTATAREDIAGVWYDDTGRGAVQLESCGTNVCGRIVWLRTATNGQGEPLRDLNNPNGARRDRPICGLPVIWGLRPQPDGTWDEGRIYDPKVGKSYDVAITRISAKRLRITGYLGTKLFSRNLIWRRAPTSLPRCQIPS